MKKQKIKDRDVLIIGSGCDLKGRKLKRFIDEYDGVVIRCNKLYGDPADIGTRTDIFFTRWNSWIGGITPILQDTDYIVVNDCIGISMREQKIILEELGHSAASCGLIAVAFCLHRGARNISVLGFGHSGASRGFFPKAYTASYKEKELLDVTRYKLDKNCHYDWRKEDAFLVNNRINLL